MARALKRAAWVAIAIGAGISLYFVRTELEKATAESLAALADRWELD